MTQEDTPRKGPSPKESSENLLAQSRRDFEQALERGESPRIEDCFGDFGSKQVWRDAKLCGVEHSVEYGGQEVFGAIRFGDGATARSV